MLPPAIKNLVDQLSKLPEIGPRAATRLTFFLLNQPDQYLKDLSQAIQELKKKTKICQNCFNLTSDNICHICTDKKRDQHTICVVEDLLDILPIEKTGQYRGLYHVLGGLIAPTEGIMPGTLHIKELEKRIKKLKEANKQIEIIIALNPTTEGDTTTLYIERLLKPLEVKITRLARGLSTGSDLEYADETTLINALLGRR